jgi:hypothetical protein
MSYPRRGLGLAPNGGAIIDPINPYGYPGSTGPPVYGPGPSVDPVSGVDYSGGGPVSTGTVDGTPVSYPGGSGPVTSRAGLFGVPWWLVLLAVVGYLASRKAKGGRSWE